MHSRRACQDRKRLGEPVYLPNLKKISEFFNQWCNLNIFQDSKCPKAVLHSLFYFCFCDLRLGKNKNSKEASKKKTHRRTDIATYGLNRPRGLFNKNLILRCPEIGSHALMFLNLELPVVYQTFNSISFSKVLNLKVCLSLRQSVSPSQELNTKLMG